MEKPRKEIYPTNFKNVVLKLSDGSIIKGKINIRGDMTRMSDFFRHSQEQFFVIVSEESEEDSKNVFFVNKNYIIWAGLEKE